MRESLHLLEVEIGGVEDDGHGVSEIRSGAEDVDLPKAAPHHSSVPGGGSRSACGARRGEEPGEPAPHRGGHGVGIGLEAVIAGDRYDLAGGAGRREPEAIALALNYEHRDLHGVELVLAGHRRLARPRRRLERKRQAEHRHRARVGGGAAGDPPTQRSAADDEWQAGKLGAAQALDHREPGRVEVRCSGRGAPAGDAVRLLDQGDADPLCEGGIARSEEVRRVGASTGSVAEDERGARFLGLVEVGTGRTARGLDVESGHTAHDVTV
jgi:hypothetical protein